MTERCNADCNFCYVKNHPSETGGMLTQKLFQVVLEHLRNVRNEVPEHHQKLCF